MSRRVLFYVQHLLGVGHVRRAAALARAMAAKNLDVTVALGGFRVALADFGGVRLYQLPPVRAADMQFSALLDENNHEVNANWWERRRARLLALYEQVDPQVILTEHFPFGRGAFRKELVPLMQAAKGRARIACSVRDVLVGIREAKADKIVDLVEHYLDRVLVHGTEALIPFTATFAAAQQFADKISYTGYVAQGGGGDAGSNAGRGEIIVSIGGGAAGESLLRAGIAAAAQERFANYRWRFLAGANLEAAVFRDLETRAPLNAIVEPARADFTTLLANCALSISQGGYNTVMDVIAAGCPNLIAPFASASESEQDFRALRFEARGLVNRLAPEDLNPEKLGDAAAAALKAGVPKAAKPDMNGADETARLILDMAENG
jgi:predicted glycosyltransferase